jgi:hypothetical protein
VRWRYSAICAADSASRAEIASLRFSDVEACGPVGGLVFESVPSGVGVIDDAFERVTNRVTRKSYTEINDGL